MADEPNSEETKTFTFTWTIRRFSLSNTFSKSNEFPKYEGKQWKGCLELYPLNEEDNTYMDIVLNLSSEISTTTECHLHILSEEKNYLIDLGVHSIDIPSSDTGSVSLKLHVKRADVIKKIKHDVLTIRCLIKFDVKEAKTNQLDDHLRKMFDDGSFSDVTLVAADRVKIQAHKCVLACSPVFAAMFTHDMKEKRKSTVTIKDIYSDVLKSMLEFIYTGKLDENKCDAEELFVAADKYALGDLKSFCEDAMIRNLEVLNAAEYLSLADRHKAKKLERKAREFIAKNLKCVLETDSMRQLASNRLSLFYDIVKNSVE